MSSNSNNTLVYFLITAAAAVGIYIATKDDKKSPVLDQEYIEEEEQETTPINNSDDITPAAQPNRSLILKKGSKGIEVKELQKLLGATPDGQFGPITENLLFAKKGVKQISLNQYAARADVPKNPLKVGDPVMASKKPLTPVFTNKTIANGNYTNTGILEDNYEYGEYIGVIKRISTDKQFYVVLDDDTFSPDLVWVRANDVVKI